MISKHSYPTSEKLGFLLQMIDNREMALPDFQRDFVWDPGMTDELIESVIQNFPAGTLLRVKNGHELLFKPREFQGAPSLAQATPAYLVLDGQQRLTSLYQALYGVGTHLFMLDLAGLEQGLDLEDCAFYDRADRVKRQYGTIQAQAEALVFPLGRIFGQGGFDKWMAEVLRSRPLSPDELLDLSQRLADIRSFWLRPIEEYEFPMVTISEDTSATAICMIFETLNRTGVKLSVFDLLTARFWPQDVRLRDLWQEALSRHPIIDEFGVDPYAVLQIVSLIEPGVDKHGLAKQPSVKRADILGQEPEQARAGWWPAVNALASVLQILREDCGVLVGRLLPYTTMLVPAAAAWAYQEAKAKGPVVGGNRSKLTRWFWCAALGQRYEYAVSSQTAKDFTELSAWMTKPEAGEPDSVAEFSFHSGSLRAVTPRQRSVYRAVMALVLRNGARDFHNRGPISPAMFGDTQNPVDDHHVLPDAYLKAKGVPSSLRDVILNRTLIDRLTNQRIGKRAPSDYLAEIRGEVGSAKFTELLTSHLLPAAEDSPLLADDFTGFMAWRESKIAEEIESVTEKRVLRGEDLEPVHLPRVEMADVLKSADQPRPEVSPAGDEDLPDFVKSLMDRRASDWTRPLVASVAHAALAVEGVTLREQKSKGEPWYFQIRHPRFKQVVAYVNVKADEVMVEYRLANSHDLYGVAEARENFYGVRLRIRQAIDLDIAKLLLKDALARAE